MNPSGMAASRLLLSSIMPWKWTSFVSIDDVVMGGVSRSQTRVSPDGNFVFEGILSTENYGGFASCRSDLAGVDRSILKGGKALTVTVRGDGNTYRLRASPMGVYDAMYYSCDFPTKRGEVKSTTCQLSTMRASIRGRTVAAPPLADASEIRSLGFLVAKDGAPEGPFQLEVLAVAVVADNSGATVPA